MIDDSLKWPDIESRLGSLEKVEGGFSNVTKGLLRLPNGKLIFIKIATAPENQKWTKKEIEVYRLLEQHEYPYMPKLLATNADDTGLAVEALTLDNGWHWEDTWSEERLIATLGAMKELADLSISEEERRELENKSLSEADNGWAKLNSSPESQKLLNEMFTKINRQDLLQLNLEDLLKTSQTFTFRYDTLVHNDIRSDNCAWNENLKQVRLIDWNWTQIGDARVDKAALFTTIKKSGFDITPWLKDLDRLALLWMAGFWFAGACKTSTAKGPVALLNSQLTSGVTALDLANSLGN